MEFDASDLPSEEFTLQRNVMDMVMLDTAECAAHMSDDGILSTLVDVVVAYDMTADQPFSQPMRRALNTASNWYW